MNHSSSATKKKQPLVIPKSAIKNQMQQSLTPSSSVVYMKPNIMVVKKSVPPMLLDASNSIDEADEDAEEDEETDTKVLRNLDEIMMSINA